MFSKLVHYASWLGLVLTAVATAYWVVVVIDGNYCWSAFAFTFGMALPLGTSILLIGVIPSAALYLRARKQRDRMSLKLTAWALAVLVAESIAVFFIIPQRGE
jgi:hypothetical protein